ANLNFHGHDIPAEIFSRINDEKINQEDISVLNEVSKRIKNGKAVIDKPISVPVGDFVLQYNFIRGYRPKGEARKDNVILDAPIEFNECG
ncbi:hypothetical protein ABK046_47140, partial [Streptomyces caeruleatus]